MNNSNWVSHTPDTKPQNCQKEDKDTAIYDNDNDNNPNVGGAEHIAPSPLRAYEKFFLPVSNSNNTGTLRNFTSNQVLQAAQASTNSLSPSPRALFQSKSYSSEAGLSSIRTEDFASASGDLSATSDLEADIEADLEIETEADLDDLSIEQKLFKNDILGLSSPIFEYQEEEEDTDQEQDQDQEDRFYSTESELIPTRSGLVETQVYHIENRIMAKGKNRSKRTKSKDLRTGTKHHSVIPTAVTPEPVAETPVSASANVNVNAPESTAPAPTPIPPATATVPEPTTGSRSGSGSEEKQHNFHVADQIYETTKTIWGSTKSKSFPLLTPLMGFTEHIATSVLSKATSGHMDSLEKVDEGLKGHIGGLDAMIVDPAIGKILEVLGPVIGKSEEVLKHVLGFVLSDKKKMIEVDDEEDEKKKDMDEVMDSSEVVSPETSNPPAVLEAEAWRYIALS